MITAMKKICLFLVLASATLNLFAQSDFYYSKNGKEESFKIRKDIVIFKTKSQVNAGKQMQYPKFKSVDIIYGDLMKATVDPVEFDGEDLAGMDGATDSFYMLEYTGDGTLQALSNQILLIPQKGESVERIIRKSELSGKVEQLELIFPEAGIYLLTLNYKMKDILPVCRRVYETGMVDVVEPNFFREVMLGNTQLCNTPSNNPLWPNQWNLKNNGQNNGTPGIDINVEPAWAYSCGNGIKVAIIDQGVDLTHPDLQANLATGLGYNATGSGAAGSYTGSDVHGTSCAGVIGAINNTIGVAGVAPECKMIPIRAMVSGTSSTPMYISSFQYAYSVGANVINNSWGIGGTPVPTLEAAITTCVNSGSVVVFCSHNDGGAVRYPADLPNVIAVGSVSRTGQRVSSSNYGESLDVVAPVDEGIYTTDLQGSLGRNTASGAAS
jgi:subtilisin family serine protease